MDEEGMTSDGDYCLKGIQPQIFCISGISGATD